MKVMLGDLIVKIVGNEDRLTTDREFFVAGEHIETSKILINKYGVLNDRTRNTLGYQFHYPFEKGDILFMTKNPYLKKCGMVDFSGICSIATFVIRTKDENIARQKYLAILMQRDEFWDYLEANKSGSVNYFITWKTLENYTFDLPEIDEQDKLINTVWAINETIESYSNLLIQSDELLCANFQELLESNKYIEESLGSIANGWSKGQNFKKDDICENGNNSCIHYGELFTKYSIFIDDVVSSTNVFPTKASTYGDILFPASDVTPDGLTKCSAILRDGVLLGGDIIVLKTNQDYNPVYLSFAIRMQKDQLLKRVTGSVVRHISAKSLQSVIVPILPIEVQNKFEQILRSVEDSKLLLINNAEYSRDILKKVINN